MADPKTSTSWNRINICDFCEAGHGVDVRPTGQGDMEERYKEAFKRAVNAIDLVRQRASRLGADQSANRAYLLAKGLVPLTYLDTLATGRTVSFKARYGEEEMRAAELDYVIELSAVLKKDVTLDEGFLRRHTVWNNSMTQQDVILLPNATRLIRGSRLDYVSETLKAWDPDGGDSFVIEVYTALNNYAYRNPVIPVGSGSSLNLATGTLALPAKSDFDLYLYEVSGAWLLDGFRSGTLRGMNAPADAVFSYVLGTTEPKTGELPLGSLMDTLTADIEVGGWKIYWLGDTPETASDDTQMLIALLHNPQTDELVAYRTSRAMLLSSLQAVEVSLFLFRDSKSDRMGEERYDVLFFDTPGGEKTFVRFITDVLEDRKLEMPRTLRVTLRPYEIDGLEWPAYSLTDHFFVMCRGTGEGVSLFGGFYKNSFDGDTFDSDYMRIEGIRDNELSVTLKKDQEIWPEKLGETYGEDLNGGRYELVDGVWQKLK